MISGGRHFFHVICGKSLPRGPVFLTDGRKEETQICSVFRLMCPEQGLGFWSSLPAGLRHSRGLGLRIIGIGINGGRGVLKQTTGVFPLIFSKAGYKF